MPSRPAGRVNIKFGSVIGKNVQTYSSGSLGNVSEPDMTGRMTISELEEAYPGCAH
jgi:hypothetical protein